MEREFEQAADAVFGGVGGGVGAAVGRYAIGWWAGRRPSTPAQPCSRLARCPETISSLMTPDRAITAIAKSSSVLVPSLAWTAIP